ncbi:MAG: hypothetical protein KBD53_09685 [Candidatus Omnitrophica bacterium]|nr:hypothetical protein [Candidatus Omnitrophota bacterium]
MNSFFKNLLAMVVIVLISVPAQAGWMDVIDKTTNKINQSSQQVDKVKRSKQQVDGMASSLPKPTAKNKKVANSATPEPSNKFALTETTNPIKGEWGSQVTCAGPNSATCQNGMDDIINCTHQSKGYFYRLVAANLQGRLDNDAELSDDERILLEEDIASLKAAVETDKVVDPDPEYPQRYMGWLTDEDQQEIQKVNIKYINEVRTDCDNRFGGMSRYSGN